MADLLEQIKNDREAGTPGPWAYRPCDHDDWGVVRAGRFLICQARDPEAVDDDFLDECRRARIDPWAANARRIARVPEMEARLLEQAAKLEAAEAMADALSQIAKETCKTKVDPDKIYDICASAHAKWKEANND